MKIPERDILPRILVPEDPSAHDECLLPGVNPGPVANFLRAAGEILSGVRPWENLASGAATLQLDQPLGAIGTVATIPVDVTDEMLADLAEDYNPDLGVMVERLTGDPFSRWTAPLAGVLLFVPTLGRGLRACEVWAEEEKDRELVRAVRAVDKAAPWIWEGERPLTFGEEPSGPCWIGRWVDAPGGRHRLGAVELPSSCRLESVYRRLELELWRYRVWKTGAGLAELLRKRPELLYRSVAEAARRCSSG